jgi:hypothetical protein
MLLDDSPEHPVWFRRLVMDAVKRDRGSGATWLRQFAELRDEWVGRGLGGMIVVFEGEDSPATLTTSQVRAYGQCRSAIGTA